MDRELAELEEKITKKDYLLGIIGLGYVGLPLSLAFLRKDISVLGFDVDQNKIDTLLSGKSYIKHVPADELTGYLQQGQFNVTADFNKLNEPDVGCNIELVLLKIYSQFIGRDMLDIAFAR